MDKRALESRLARYGQEHVLAFWDELDAAGRAQLAEQLADIDLDLVDSLYRTGSDAVNFAELARRAEPPHAIRLAGDQNPFSPEAARARGEAALREGQVAVLVTAGGQGSRLGFAHPKSLYKIGPISGASLLQIHIEKIRATARRYGVSVPLYVMTSPVTDQETRRFLDEHDRFGLAADDVFVFCQGTMPAVDAATGKLLLAGRDRLFLSPDGHGGTVKALRRSEAFADLARRGIEHIFYFQVDNPLATVCDPEFIGYHLLAESEYTLQVIGKRSPQEKLGNVVRVDERTQIIEYSDLPDEAAEWRNDDGSLKLWAGSIAVHMFGVDFLRRVAESDVGLPFHRAIKRVPHLGEGGEPVEPAEPNAVKFEQFIFDLLPLARESLSVEVAADDTFAALKNAPGAPLESPEYVQRMMSDLHRRWLRQVGAEVDEQTIVEISPLFALDAEQLAERVAPGTVVSDDTYFC
ncbi:MAG: UDPGP type 1 family protein [Planctomycetota bacterium]|nr:MAG: UDPGP type 1 family protein [Planctomycetota bacterium]REJ92377.1 MAG: UDPGP type 1 family protein [Planctomycetota bacterium]REK30299.1 MAG: UDPGP type 1 family protein [Planctomycetota bacterium]REK44589.1 MAG: UDPGP type 1 family protein [Planctomycetota bacterium]